MKLRACLNYDDYEGYGSLGVSVEGAHRSDLELKATNPTDYHLQYKPHEPGVYQLNIKFGDDHITGTYAIIITIIITLIASKILPSI